MIDHLISQYKPTLNPPIPEEWLNRIRYRNLLKKNKKLGNRIRVQSKSGYNHIK